MSQSTNYIFIDNLRYWSITLIVFGHSDVLSHIGGYWLQDFDVSFMFYVLSKFDLTCMFIISGFLLPKTSSLKEYQYLFRRMQRIVPAWLFWVMAIFIMYRGYYWLLNITPNLSPLEQLLAISYKGIYWFIPVYIFTLWLMFLLLRYLPERYIAIVLVAISFIYGINIYLGLFATGHTTAWFGYLLYFWLGIKLKENWAKVEEILKKIPITYIIASAVLCAFIVLGEDFIIQYYDFPSPPANVIKLSNFPYTFCMFFLFVKIHKSIVPAIIDPRRDTFGIYLTHVFTLPLIMFLLKRVFPAEILATITNQNQWLKFIYWLIMGVVVHFISLLVVRIMVKIGLGRFVGHTLIHSNTNSEPRIIKQS